MKRQPIRHGELLLLPVEEQDMTGAVEEVNYVASHSETEHHHVLTGRSQVLEVEGRDTLVRLAADTTVEHRKSFDRHDTVAVPAGDWKILRKKEYDPFAKVMREVWD